MSSLSKLTAELWSRGNLKYKLWPQQQSIYEAIYGLPPDIDEAVVLCARQFGKSHLGVLIAIEQCLRWHDRCFLIIGPTLKQTREIVTPRLRHIIADAPPGLIRPSKSEGKWYIGTSELVMGGFDLNTNSQRGKTLQGVFVEEIVDANPDDYLESLRSDIGPALTHSDAGKIIFLTTLPKVPDHPFITETMARAQINNSFYSFTIDDNKALSQSQYEACVRRAGGRHTDDFKREYLNQIIRDKSVVVIPDFDPARHIGEFDLPEYCNYEIYIDWGGVRDFTVAVVVGYGYLEATDFVFDELWWGPNTPTEVIVNDIRTKWTGKYLQPNRKEHVYYADVPGQLAVDLGRTFKMSVALPQKSDWEASINGLANRFTQNKIKIAPHCKLTITTCQSGMFNKNHTDFERTISTGHCDAIAALMYAVRGLNRSNPYPNEIASKDRFWTPPSDKPINILPSANKFGATAKKFGAK